jgi:hypothetical protein
MLPRRDKQVDPASLACGCAMGEIKQAQRVTVKNSGAK